MAKPSICCSSVDSEITISKCRVKEKFFSSNTFCIFYGGSHHDFLALLARMTKSIVLMMLTPSDAISPLISLPPFATPSLTLSRNVPRGRSTCSYKKSCSPPATQIKPTTVSIVNLPAELRILALTQYASFGTILKLSCTCKALKPLSNVVIEQNKE